jgi:hypothetical protein
MKYSYLPFKIAQDLDHLIPLTNTLNEVQYEY